MGEDRGLTVILGLVVGLVLFIFCFWAVAYGHYFLFVGVSIPMAVFFAIFFLMAGLKKRILAQLRTSFGENTMKIATAIMDFFEVPLTLLLSVVVTLFIFAAAVLVILAQIWSLAAAAGAG